MATKKSDENKPWISNYPPLAEWLAKHEARCMWQKIDRYMSIEAWLIRDVIIIVQVHANKSGWDIFTPNQDPGLEATFTDAEKRCGIWKAEK